jgi:hypothetical protein
MAIQTISTAYNPVSGIFGTGQVQMFFTSGAWTVPTGISRVRARVWGAGGGGGVTAGAAGGGFSLKTIYDLTGVTSIAITVGAGGVSGAVTGGTSSFGGYCSATGGTASAGGSGSGGDINYSGGNTSGGGAASIFGPGNGNVSNISGGAGQGATSATTLGLPGFFGAGGGLPSVTAPNPPMSGLQQFSIDYIGTGGGGGNGQNGINGSGAGGGVITARVYGGIPGGGGGSALTTSTGGQGLVIVEW